MMEYQKSLVTPEEKVIRERIYEAFAEIINGASGASWGRIRSKTLPQSLLLLTSVRPSPPCSAGR
jgi:hypothetical protein